VLKTSCFVSVFSFLGSYVWVSEWVSAKGEVREREREVRQQYEQDYCPGLLPRTIAQYYCLSNTKYLHRNYCFKSYLRTIVRIFYGSTTTSFFFWTWCNSPIPKKKWGVKVGNWTTKHRSSSFGSTLASHEIFESVQNFLSVVCLFCRATSHKPPFRSFAKRLLVRNLWERASSLFSLCT
jgi:hypothetical protein